MAHSQPEQVTPKLLAELHRITPYAPDHLPHEIALIEAFTRRHPELPQVACFDTAFHRTLRRVAKLLPIPRRYMARGVERYGFHGLSYAYLMEELGRLDPAATKGGVPRPSRQRRQPGCRAQWQEHRHQHGLHAHLRIGDEHAHGRPGSRPHVLPGAR